jgi:hypothetical protein
MTVTAHRGDYEEISAASNSSDSGKKSSKNNLAVTDRRSSNLTTSTSKINAWNLEGAVQFLGKPCPPNSSFSAVPPCSGPYPNYEVIIYSGSSKTIAAKIRTDPNGVFRTWLEPGSYTIYTRAGISASHLKTTHFLIQEGKITRLNTLIVDTGLE